MKEHVYVNDLLALAAAGLIDPAERRRVETHLDDCEACRAEFTEWMQLTGALKELPTPQAPGRLVLQTQRLLSHTANIRKSQTSQVGLALLVGFSWMAAFMSIAFIRMFDIPLARWLDVPSTAVWIVYIGISWLATALATGLLGRRYQQEGRTL